MFGKSGRLVSGAVHDIPSSAVRRRSSQAGVTSHNHILLHPTQEEAEGHPLVHHENHRQ